MNTKRHKHADLIHAWAEGEKIEQKYKGSWIDSKFPSFFDEVEYRIKPEKKPDVVLFTHTHVNCTDSDWPRVENLTYNDKNKRTNLKLTFDGETGELKSAEVIK